MLDYPDLRTLSPWRSMRMITTGFSRVYFFFLRWFSLERRTQNKKADTFIPLPSTSFPSSTATFFRLRDGVILKSPTRVTSDTTLQPWSDGDSCCRIERQLLETLGPSPNIVKYLGWKATDPTGLLLQEANHGDLQSFLDNQTDHVTASLRQKWFRQIVEAVAYIHNQGIIHGDLRPSNFLLYDSDIALCDFGGSTCHRLDIAGQSLPHAGFLNPNLPLRASFNMDIFSMGSVLYTVAAGHWPFRPGPATFSSLDDLQRYRELTDAQFSKGHYPIVDNLVGGEIIRGCWDQTFNDTREVKALVLQLLIPQHLNSPELLPGPVGRVHTSHPA